MQEQAGMNIKLHKNARTTPAVRAQIAPAPFKPARWQAAAA
jgi:hypothetical protein